MYSTREDKQEVERIPTQNDVIRFLDPTFDEKGKRKKKSQRI